MEVTLLETLATLRTVVGYLGEKEQLGWWQSSFFSPGAAAFLAPVFGRTQVLAQCTGVTRAAALIHDERIGVGSVYHLFRLPEEVEQGIHRVLLEKTFSQRILSHVVDRATAGLFLRNASGGRVTDGLGPTRVGAARDLSDLELWQVTAAHYGRAFEQRTEVFPYLTDRA